MPILYIRDVPEKMYRLLQQRAEAQRRSLSAVVVAILDQALAADDTRSAQADILDRMRRHRQAYRPADAGAPDSVALLREDRDR